MALNNIEMFDASGSLTEVTAICLIVQRLIRLLKSRMRTCNIDSHLVN